MFQLMGNFFAGGMEAVSHGPCLFVGTSYHVADIMKMAVLEGISDPFRQNNPVYARLDKWRLTAIQVGTILAEDRSIYLRASSIEYKPYRSSRAFPIFSASDCEKFLSRRGPLCMMAP